MEYMLQFFPEVEADVVSGYNWFEDKAPGLGEEFIRLFYACAGGIQRNPMLHPVNIQSRGTPFFMNVRREKVAF